MAKVKTEAPVWPNVPVKFTFWIIHIRGGWGGGFGFLCSKFMQEKTEFLGEILD